MGIRYNPALDGLRALAVLAVVAFHCRVPFFRGGTVGVDVFFVLSGYLITRVLEANGDLRTFYWRRATRLVPPLAFMLAGYLLVFPLVKPDYPHSRDALLAFLYLSDYSVAFWHLPKWLQHTWSLSVEEHFYLVWPLIFLRWRPSTRALVIAYFLALAWRYGWPEYHEAYSRFDTRLSGLILGCLIARFQRLEMSAALGMVALGFACIAQPFGSPLDKAGIQLAVELCSAFVILGRLPLWVSAAPMVYLGKLSYGIYLWHYPVARLLRGTLPWYETLAITLIVSVGMAAVSYHTIEAYFRRARTSRIPDSYQPAP